MCTRRVREPACVAPLASVSSYLRFELGECLEQRGDLGGAELVTALAAGERWLESCIESSLSLLLEPLELPAGYGH